MTLLARLFRGRPRQHALIAIGAAIGCVLVGGAVFAATHHLPDTTGWYWAITTTTTVGYGDVISKNASGQLVASLVILTTIPLLATTFALFTASAVARGVGRTMQMGEHFPDGSYRVVIGAHPAVSVALEELVAADAAVVLVSDADADADADASSVPEGVHHLQGDPTNERMLSSARLAGANRIFIASADDGDALITAVTVREQAPGGPGHRPSAIPQAR